MKRQALALVGPMLLAIGCSDGGGSNDATTDSDATTDQPSTCRQDPDPLNPHYRMTLLDIQSPDRLNNPALEEGIVREALNQETFLWLFRFQGVDDGTTDTDGTLEFETGSGLVENVDHNGCYPLLHDTEYPIRTGNMSISGDAISWPPAEPSFDIDIPIFNWDYTYLLKLPLKDVRITAGSFTADRTALGIYAGGEWSCGASITGLITVADARLVEIADMSQLLCAVLSGQVGVPDDMTDDCQGDPSTWPTPPDTTYLGEPAYSMSGCFAAEQVIVID